MGGIDQIGRAKDTYADTNELQEEAAHITHIFPEDTNETVTFTAGGSANTFSSWVDVSDNNGVKLSSKTASTAGHMSKILVEDVSVDDVVYLLEISYGAAKTILTRTRFMNGSAKLPIVQTTSVHAEHCPAGEGIFYRMKCETGSATAQVHFRYHFHS